MRTTQIHGKTYEIDGKDAFTPAEEQTLDLWLQAMSVEDAARAICRSPDTVKSHRKAIRQKTAQRNGEGVLMYCFSKGYVRLLTACIFIGASLPTPTQNAPRDPAKTHIRVPKLARKEINLSVLEA